MKFKDRQMVEGSGNVDDWCHGRVALLGKGADLARTIYKED
jgi:hypothetical protein